jgi:heavy metal sensor kinase
MSLTDSIKFKFTLWYLAVLGSILIFLGSGIYLSLSRQLNQNLDNSLMMRAEQISNFRDIIGIVAGGTFEEEPGELVAFYFYSGNGLTKISQKGNKIPVDKAWIDHILDGNSEFKTGVNDGVTLRLYAIPYHPEISGGSQPIEKDKRGPPPGPRRRPARVSGKRDRPFGQFAPPKPVDVSEAVLLIARPVKGVEIVLDRLFQILICALPLTLVLSGGGGIFLLSRALNPVDQITKTAREIGETDLSRRVDVRTKDELGKLGVTLNLMIERLEKAFQRQKELTGDASHELRAPLAVIQAESTLALQKERDTVSYQKALVIIANEAGHMSGIIKQLLFLARIDSGNERISFHKFNLSQATATICNDVNVLFLEKELTLDLKIQDQLEIIGDEKLLRNLILNLLTNAIHYSPSGGQIIVALYQEYEKVVLSVMDKGIGIPDDALSKIFDRFYRVDKARSRDVGGSGLGLAICKQIVQMHNGKIQVVSKINQGAQFFVRFQLA